LIHRRKIEKEKSGGGKVSRGGVKKECIYRVPAKMGIDLFSALVTHSWGKGFKIRRGRGWGRNFARLRDQKRGEETLSEGVRIGRNFPRELPI